MISGRLRALMSPGVRINTPASVFELSGCPGYLAKRLNEPERREERIERVRRNFAVGAQRDDLEEPIIDNEQPRGKLHCTPAGITPRRLDRFGRQNFASIARGYR